MADAKLYSTTGLDDNNPQYRDRYDMHRNPDGTTTLTPVLGAVGNPSAKPLSGENVKKLDVAVSAIDDRLIDTRTRYATKVNNIAAVANNVSLTATKIPATDPTNSGATNTQTVMNALNTRITNINTVDPSKLDVQDLTTIGYNDITHTLKDIPLLLKTVTGSERGTIREYLIINSTFPNLKLELTALLGVYGLRSVSNDLSLTYESKKHINDTTNSGNFVITSISIDTFDTFFPDFTLPFYNGEIQRLMPLSSGGAYSGNEVDINTIVKPGVFYFTNMTNIPSFAKNALINVYSHLLPGGYEDHVVVQEAHSWNNNNVILRRFGKYVKADVTNTERPNAISSWTEWEIIGGYITLFSNRETPLTNATLNTTAIPNINKFKTIEIYYSPNEGLEQPRWVVMQRGDDGTFEGNVNYNQLGGQKYDISISLAWDEATSKCINQLAYLERTEVPSGNTIASDVASGTFIYEIIGKELII